MGRTLKPEDRISHYRVIGPLGAGGMGEVYRAQDQTLERHVALKILPPELVRSEERVRRFVLEAKSASSLNHPHIVTIYEIGQDRVRSGEGGTGAVGAAREPDSSPLHFISMELVSGKTLAAKIHQEETDLKTLLGWLAQAAEGLAKAHAAGIVHRDLKPANIMITQDGYAKVLDFGLAKLTERQLAGPEMTSAPTVADEGTGDGMVLGTAGYMAPEQVQGKLVDHRADVFSFGAILYEAATRQRPFAAESQVETLHQILHQVPAPIEALNPEAPAELRRLIRRCLTKDPNQRIDSMKTLALELREIVDEYDVLSASASSGSGAQAVPQRRTMAKLPILAAIVLVTLALAGGWLVLQRGSRPVGPPRDMSLRTVTSRGDVSDAVISPDGRYLAYVAGPIGRAGIWVRQLGSDAEVQILPPTAGRLRGLRFSPDGSSILYCGPNPSAPGSRALYEISTLGGTPVRRVSDLGPETLFALGRVFSIAPGGRKICFLRETHNGNRVGLVVLDLDGGQERVLATSVLPRVFIGAPSWSPDGRKIATIEYSDSAGRDVRVVGFRVKDGRREVIDTHSWGFVNSLAWLPDGRALVLSARDEDTPTVGIWLLPCPTCESRRITNDPGSYQHPSTSSDGASIAAVRLAAVANAWSVDTGTEHRVRQLTFASNEEGSIYSWAPDHDGSVVFIRGGDLTTVCRGAPDGSGARPILSGAALGGNFVVQAGGGIVFSKRGQDRVFHLWRADSDGGNPRQLTNTARGEMVEAISPDGRVILFRPRTNRSELWRVDVEDGDNAQLANSVDMNRGVRFSPDGTRILYRLIERDAGSGRAWRTISATGGEPDHTVLLPSEAHDLEWSPDGKALTYLARAGAMNVLRQRFDGGNAAPVTRFAEGEITDHEWSPDGTRIALVRRTQTANVWTTSADGSHPVQLTRFETGAVFGIDWMPEDGRHILFTYGQESNDAVLIRNFR